MHDAVFGWNINGVTISCLVNHADIAALEALAQLVLLDWWVRQLAARAGSVWGSFVTTRG